jgi:hypothetical protein
MENIYQFNIINKVNINEVTKDDNNSILLIKINPNIQNEFIIVNSNFVMYYLQINIMNYNIQIIGEYKEHKERINDISFFVSNSSPWKESFVSGDNEGLILIWNSGSKNSSYKISTNGKGQVLTLDTKEFLLAAGYGNVISIWDTRKMKLIGKSSFGHSELVRCVKFYDIYLLTAGEDNIINIFNLKNTDIDSKEINKNLLNKDNIEATINLGQSVLNVFPIQTGYISAITTVNTFHVVSLENCTSQYEFDAKNEKLKINYILDSYFNQNTKNIELLVGSFEGRICLIDIFIDNKGNGKYNVKYILDTNIEQMFNSAGRFNEKLYIFVSDKGLIYLLSTESQNKIENENKNKNNYDMIDE